MTSTLGNPYIQTSYSRNWKYGIHGVRARVFGWFNRGRRLPFHSPTQIGYYRNGFHGEQHIRVLVTIHTRDIRKEWNKDSLLSVQGYAGATSTLVHAQSEQSDRYLYSVHRACPANGCKERGSNANAGISEKQVRGPLEAPNKDSSKERKRPDNIEYKPRLPILGTREADHGALQSKEKAEGCHT